LDPRFDDDWWRWPRSAGNARRRRVADARVIAFCYPRAEVPNSGAGNAIRPRRNRGWRRTHAQARPAITVWPGRILEWKALVLAARVRTTQMDPRAACDFLLCYLTTPESLGRRNHRRASALVLRILRECSRHATLIAAFRRLGPAWRYITARTLAPAYQRNWSG
jgi:hypothetical protein